MAAAAAQKVVLRCEDAKNTGHLDMSGCELMSVPNAIYMLLKSTPPTLCNLSCNELKRIPAKLCTTFPAITELRARENKLTTLPEEIGQLGNLRLLDIGSNSIKSLPSTLFKLPFLEELYIDNNLLSGVDVDRLLKMPSLRKVSFHNNSLPDDTRERLRQCGKFTVEV